MHREQLKDAYGDYVDTLYEDDIDEYEESNAIDGVNEKYIYIHASDVGISRNIGGDYINYGTQKESCRLLLSEELVNTKQWNIKKGKREGSKVRPCLVNAYEDFLKSIGEGDE